ncbi:MAG: hypothetical protein PHR16_18275 [Methylovulum sp.]|nr:hypothetical protein [Methylovulum sp.]
MRRSGSGFARQQPLGLLGLLAAYKTVNAGILNLAVLVNVGQNRLPDLLAIFIQIID